MTIQLKECSVCSCSAKVKKSDNEELYLVYCEGCNYYVSPASKEEVARHRWNRVNESHRDCLGCNGKPRIRYHKNGSCLFQCTKCFFSCHPTYSEIAAISHWHRTNEPNNPIYLMLWKAEFEKQVIQNKS